MKKIPEWYTIEKISRQISEYSAESEAERTIFMKQLDGKSETASRRFSPVGLVGAGLTLLAALLQTLLLFLFYDSTTGFYEYSRTSLGRALLLGFSLLIGAGGLLALLMICFPRKLCGEDMTRGKLPRENGWTRYIGTLASALLLFIVLRGLYSLLGGGMSTLGTTFTRRLSGLLRLLFGLPGSAYFAVLLLGKPSYRQNRLAVLCGMGTVLWSACSLLFDYFAMNSPLRSPVYLLSQMFYLTLTLFLTLELRTLLGRPLPRFYRAVCLVFCLLGGSHALSSLMALRAEILSGSLLQYILELVLVMYALTRLCAATGDQPGDDTLPQEPKADIPQEEDEEDDAPADAIPEEIEEDAPAGATPEEIEEDDASAGTAPEAVREDDALTDGSPAESLPKSEEHKAAEPDGTAAGGQEH